MIRPISRVLAEIAAATVLLLLAACSSTPQVQRSLGYQDFSLSPGDLAAHGVAFVTPSSITGHEQDRQTVAFLFAQVLRRERPEIPVVTLAETLSRINAAGMAIEYRDMLDHMDATGVLPGDFLSKIGQVTGARYVVMLKLAQFQSESSRRFGLFSFRLVTTRIATLRLFYQIWDTETASIAWEANQEMTLAFDTVKEEVVTFESMVNEVARDLITRMPHPCEDDPARECPRPDGLIEADDMAAGSGS